MHLGSNRGFGYVLASPTKSKIGTPPPALAARAKRLAGGGDVGPGAAPCEVGLLNLKGMPCSAKGSVRPDRLGRHLIHLAA